MSESNNVQTTTTSTTDTTQTAAPAAAPATDQATDTTAATQTATTQPAPNPTTETQPAAEPEKQETLLGTPESTVQYTEFEMPEGFELNPDDGKALQELGQKFNMGQEDVQKLVNLGVQMQQRQVQEQQKIISSWVDAAKADPEYGGDKLAANLLTAQRAFSLPRGDKVSKILHMSGLGNHPDVVGFMTEVGKLLQPDNVTTGKGSNTTPTSLGDLWYGDK